MDCCLSTEAFRARRKAPWSRRARHDEDGWMDGWLTSAGGLSRPIAGPTNTQKLGRRYTERAQGYKATTPGLAGQTAAGSRASQKTPEGHVCQAKWTGSSTGRASQSPTTEGDEQREPPSKVHQQVNQDRQQSGGCPRRKERLAQRARHPRSCSPPEA